MISTLDTGELGEELIKLGEELKKISDGELAGEDLSGYIFSLYHSGKFRADACDIMRAKMGNVQFADFVLTMGLYCAEKGILIVERWTGEKDEVVKYRGDIDEFLDFGELMISIKAPEGDDDE